MSLANMIAAFACVYYFTLVYKVDMLRSMTKLELYSQQLNEQQLITKAEHIKAENQQKLVKDYY